MCDRVVRLGEEDVDRTVITVGKQGETISAVFSERCPDHASDLF